MLQVGIALSSSPHKRRSWIDASVIPGVTGDLVNIRRCEIPSQVGNDDVASGNRTLVIPGVTGDLRNNRQCEIPNQVGNDDVISGNHPLVIPAQAGI